MKSRVLTQRNRRTAGAFLLIGVLAGLLYPLLGREILDPIAIINGLTIGVIGSMFLSFTELYLDNPLKKRMKFIPQVIIKTIFYASFFVLLILFVYSFNRSLFSDDTYFEYLKGPEFSNFVYEGDFNVIVVYTLVICAATIFTHQISLKMGQGILLNLIFGKYHIPRREDRIFMFLDLCDSTSIAELMGEVQFNEFINEFFQDITDVIIQHYGVIYRYVGDEMVVSWRPSQGLRNINCLRAYYGAQEIIRKNREKYIVKYEVVPHFTAGFHIGSIVIGQVGDVKSQIVFSGYPLYEGHLIEKNCKVTSKSHLISEALMEQLQLPSFYESSLVSETDSPYSDKIKLHTVSTIDY